MPVELPGTVSSKNCSTTPLGGNATFNGAADRCLGAATIMVMVKSDQASATNGLMFDWYDDTQTLIRTESSSVNANTGRTFSLTPRGIYFGLRYTNGPTPQGTFNICTAFQPVGSGIISRPLDESLSTENFVHSVRSVNAFDLGSGTFGNVSVAQPFPTTNKTPLTAVAPATFAVTTSSSQAVASNSSRKGLVLTNTGTKRVSFGLGASAVLDSGITLQPGDVWVMDEYTFSTSAVNAIAATGGSSLGIQEFS